MALMGGRSSGFDFVTAKLYKPDVKFMNVI